MSPARRSSHSAHRRRRPLSAVAGTLLALIACTALAGAAAESGDVLELEQWYIGDLNGQPAILGVFTPINVATLQATLLTAKYAYAPARGFGYNVALTADSSILQGIPVSAYNGFPAVPANNVQVCGNAQFTPGLATCIPYLKGYGQMTYQWQKGAFLALGVDYEGKNNAYYQPPFAIADLTYRQPIVKHLDFQLSVQNLFNTNSYNYLPAPNLGVPAVGNYTTDGNTIQQGSYSTYLIPAPTRTLRFSMRAHVGR